MCCTFVYLYDVRIFFFFLNSFSYPLVLILYNHHNISFIYLKNSNVYAYIYRGTLYKEFTHNPPLQLAYYYRKILFKKKKVQNKYKNGVNECKNERNL